MTTDKHHVFSMHFCSDSVDDDRQPTNQDVYLSNKDGQPSVQNSIIKLSG